MSEPAPIALSPKVLVVGPDRGAFHSISDAARLASEGDQILVSPGVYSPSRTGESFPIYLPPGCSLMGTDAQSCVLDGEGRMAIILRPLDQAQCLILCGDNTVVTRLTVRNSGANAVATQARSRVLVSDSVVCDNGQHGLLLFAPDCVVVRRNRFLNNGTARTFAHSPRPVIGRQGHHIFVESGPGSANRALIFDNELKTTLADGIGMEVFDQPDGISMWLQVVGNVISGCDRNGITIAGSYGPANVTINVDIRDNQFLDNSGNGVEIEAAISLVNRAVRRADLTFNCINNTVDGAQDAIAVFGAFSPSHDARVRCTIIGNSVRNARQYGIRVIGGVGLDGWPCSGGTVQAVISRNTLDAASIADAPIFVQGGVVARGAARVTENTVFALISANDAGGSESIIVNDGPKSNRVEVLADTQPLTRQPGVIPFRP